MQKSIFKIIYTFFFCISVFLVVFVYIGGDLFPYRDPLTGEVEIDEENISFQPFSIFIPKDAFQIEVQPDYVKYMGKTQYEYIPESIPAFLLGYKTLPIWRVTLKGPQFPESTYPEGITVLFRMTDFVGMVADMNAINHYIGMLPMEAGAVFLRKLVPFCQLALLISLFVGYFYSKRFWFVFWVIPALIPVYFSGIYYYSLYWFGHNMSAYAPFKIPPFTPVFIGQSQVANFNTYSYPAIGFYIFIATFICLSFAIFFKLKTLSFQKKCNGLI